MGTPNPLAVEIAEIMDLDAVTVKARCEWIFAYGKDHLDGEYKRILKVLNEPGPWRNQPTLPGSYWIRQKDLGTHTAVLEWVRYVDEYQKGNKLFAGPVYPPGENDA